MVRVNHGKPPLPTLLPATSTSTKVGSVADRHNQYLDHLADWVVLRDVLAGERRMKEKQQTYVPAFADQSSKEYQEYLARAFFLAATERTRDGLVGAIFRRPPKIDLGPGNDDLLPYLDEITRDGLSFTQFAREAAQEVIGIGRYAAVVDRLPDAEVPLGEVNAPYIVGYRAEDVTQWRAQRVGPRFIPTQVIVREVEDTFISDGFGMSEENIYRELRLDRNEETGALEYRQRIYRLKEVNPRAHRAQQMGEPLRPSEKVWAPDGDDIVPLVYGSPLRNLPVTFFNPSSGRPDIEKSPLLNIANLNVHHFRSSADLAHGRHYTALPVFMGTGVPDGFVFDIGPGKALTSGDADTRFGLLEYTGQGLKFAENAVQDFERQMAVMGARLITSPTDSGSEAPEVVKLRERGERSTLSALVDNLERQLTRVLRDWVRMFGRSAEGVKVQLNRDFADGAIAYRDALMLIRFFQAGVMPLDGVLEALHEGEALPTRMTVERVKELLKDPAQRPTPLPGDAKGKDMVTAVVAEGLPDLLSAAVVPAPTNASQAGNTR